MTSVSELLIGEKAGGRFISDPRDLDRWAVSKLFFSAGISFGFIDGMTTNVNDFWNVLSGFGTNPAGAVTTAWAADTYKTLLDVTGRGFLEHIVGPQIGPGVTSTIRVTVDGSIYLIPYTNQTVYSTNSPRRQVLGGLEMTYSSVSEAYQEKILDLAAPLVTSNGHLANFDSGTGANPIFINRSRMMELGQILKYTTNLKVEMKVSSAIATGSANLAHNAGVRYRVAN